MSKNVLYRKISELIYRFFYPSAGPLPEGKKDRGTSEGRIAFNKVTELLDAFGIKRGYEKGGTATYFANILTELQKYIQRRQWANEEGYTVNYKLEAAKQSIEGKEYYIYYYRQTDGHSVVVNRKEANDPKAKMEGTGVSDLKYFSLKTREVTDADIGELIEIPNWRKGLLMIRKLIREMNREEKYDQKGNLIPPSDGDDIDKEEKAIINAEGKAEVKDQKAEPEREIVVKNVNQTRHSDNGRAIDRTIYVKVDGKETGKILVNSKTGIPEQRKLKADEISFRQSIGRSTPGLASHPRWDKAYEVAAELKQELGETIEEYYERTKSELQQMLKKDEEKSAKKEEKFNTDYLRFPDVTGKFGAANYDNDSEMGIVSKKNDIYPPIASRSFGNCYAELIERKKINGERVKDQVNFKELNITPRRKPKKKSGEKKKSVEKEHADLLGFTSWRYNLLGSDNKPLPHADENTPQLYGRTIKQGIKNMQKIGYGIYDYVFIRVKVGRDLSGVIDKATDKKEEKKEESKETTVKEGEKEEEEEPIRIVWKTYNLEYGIMYGLLFGDAYQMENKFQRIFIPHEAGYDKLIKRYIAAIHIHVVRQNSGGCNDAKGVIYSTIGPYRTISNVSTGVQNCFFANLKTIGIKLENEEIKKVREKYFVPQGWKVDPITAIKIMEEEYHIHGSIHDYEGGILHKTKECDNKEIPIKIKMLLAKGHYSIILSDRTNPADKIDEKMLIKAAEECRLRKVTYRKVEEDLTEIVRIIHVDIETYTLPNGTAKTCVVGYSCSWDPRYDVRYFFEDKDPMYVDLPGKPRPIRDPMDSFVRMCEGWRKEFYDKDCKYNKSHKMRKKTSLYINAYNGSRYDFYPFAGSYLSQYGSEGVDFLRKNSILIQFAKDGLKTIDLMRHVPPTARSLKKLLETLKLPIKKGTFDVTRLGPWLSLSEETKRECLEYLKSDVLGLRLAYEKMNEKYMEKYKCNISSHLASATLAYRIYRSMLKDDPELSGTFIGLNTGLQNSIIVKSVFGGRTQACIREFTSEDYKKIVNLKKEHDDLLEKKRMIPHQILSEYGSSIYSDFHNDNKIPFSVVLEELDRRQISVETEIKAKEYERRAAYKELKDYYCCGDVTSLYPYVMKNFEYPMEWPIETDGYKEHYLGIYHVKFVPNKSLSQVPVPRTDNGNLVWDLKPGEGMYTNIDIDLMKKYKYEKIEIGKGYYWPRSRFAFKTYVDRMYRDKQLAAEQMAKEEKEGKEPNRVMYDAAKNMLNSLYGKLLQHVIYLHSWVVTENHQIWEINRNYVLTDMDIVSRNGGRKIAVCSGYHKDEAKREKCNNKPTHLGAFILSYSRLVMSMIADKMNAMYGVGHDTFAYTDTDSYFFHAKHSHILDKSDDIGSFVDELKGGKIIRAIFIAPKLYAVQYLMPNGEIYYKFRMKGCKPDGLSNQDLMDRFEKMNKGESVIMPPFFSVNTVGPNVTDKQRSDGIDPWNLIHRMTTREINTSQWQGRDFIGNFSVPHGHESEEWQKRRLAATNPPKSAGA